MLTAASPASHSPGHPSLVRPPQRPANCPAVAPRCPAGGCKVLAFVAPPRLGNCHRLTRCVFVFGELPRPSVPKSVGGVPFLRRPPSRKKRAAFSRRTVLDSAKKIGSRISGATSRLAAQQTKTPSRAAAGSHAGCEWSAATDTARLSSAASGHCCIRIVKVAAAPQVFSQCRTKGRSELRRGGQSPFAPRTTQKGTVPGGSRAGLRTGERCVRVDCENGSRHSRHLLTRRKKNCARPAWPAQVSPRTISDKMA